jgi:hypothetical protein
MSSYRDPDAAEPNAPRTAGVPFWAIHRPILDGLLAGAVEVVVA